MADTAGFPQWLLKSKEQIIKTAVCINRTFVPLGTNITTIMIIFVQ